MNARISSGIAKRADGNLIGGSCALRVTTAWVGAGGPSTVSEIFREYRPDQGPPPVKISESVKLSVTGLGPAGGGMVRDFIAGVRYFGQGLGMLFSRPRLLLTGMLPAVLTTALLAGAMIALLANIGDLAALITPFADHWSGGWREATRFAAGLTLVGSAVLVGLVGFTTLTLVVGGPFYEHIAERIEDDLGATEGHVDLSWGKLLLLGVRDGILLLLRSLVFTVLLFLAGFLPVVGQSVVPVLLVLVTAWFIALEVVAVPFYRRGIDLRGRTAMLRRRR